jgi:hypothetical protein
LVGAKTLPEKSPYVDTYDRRNLWTYKILKIAYLHFPADPKIENVLEFARSPQNWGEGREGRFHEAHRIVDAVNHLTSAPLIFHLATQVGKIVYTAQQYPAPFDHSAGWKIAEILKQIVQQINNSEFEKKAWQTLADEGFIVLEKPIMCHPACPTCAVNGLTPMSKYIKR